MGLREVVEPRGVLPPSVYWLRRAAVALPIVAVLVLITVLATRGGSPSASSSVSTLPSGTPPASFTFPVSPTSSGATTTSSPSATPTTSPSTPPSTQVSARVSPSSAAAASTVCSPASLVLSVAPATRSYAVGALIHFTATLRTRGPACTATGAVAVVVTSGSDRLWGSTDCVAAHTATTPLTAAHPAAALRSWNQVRTLPGCRKVVGTTTAKPGNYRVVATWDGVTSAPLSFRLT